jgi:hypothetical protein
MDVAMLRDRIQATLDPNAAIRQQAELDLKHVRGLPKHGALDSTNKNTRPKSSQALPTGC